MQEMNVEDRVELSRAIIRILENWGLDAGAQVALLDLPKGTRARAMRRYRDNTPLPESPQVMVRMEHVVAIADGLRTTFPLSAPMGVRWLQTPNRRLGHRIPLAIMLEDGLAGLEKVRSYLDCAYAWQQTEAGVR